MVDYPHCLLWCFIINDSNPFEIRVPVNTSVSRLKKLIWEERKKSILRESDAVDLMLWHLETPEPAEPLDTLPQRIASREGVKLENPWDTVLSVFPNKPAAMSVHIKVEPGLPPQPINELGELDPDARKRSPAYHSVGEERRKRQKGSPEVAQGLENGRRLLVELHKRIRQLSAEPEDYSDPSRPIELPFPSTNLVPSRFAISENGTFLFLGREKFAVVWDIWLKVSADFRHRRAIYVYGTRGYGKSHILAALACLLVRNNRRVVYIPDCRAMLSRPLVYLRNALLFAFEDPQSSEYRKRIWECQHVEAFGDFCEKYEDEGGHLCFIIDQLNALDPEPKGQDDVTDEQKASISSLLRRMAAGHVEITSASANHKTAKHMERKDTGEQKITLLGGMTKVEMYHWWLRNTEDFAAFSDDDKLRVEDLTGRIPLLLEPFLGNPGTNLEALEPEVWNQEILASVVKTTYDFGVEQSADPHFRTAFIRLMQACLIHSPVSRSAPMLDYRYFYLKNGCGRYTCGLARQGIVEFLRIYAEESVFLGPEWYRALQSFKNNPSVIGFTVEQMVISRLASSGLRWGDTVIPPAPLTPFSGSVTALSIDKPSTYYVPLQFNFKAIDTLYVEVNEHKRTAKIVAIQITVAKRHTDSASKFFADWEAWISSLRGFTVTPMFLWIVENKRGQDEVEEKLIELRQRQITAIPAHTTHWVMIDQVDKMLAETLAIIHPEASPSQGP